MSKAESRTRLIDHNRALRTRIILAKEDIKNQYSVPAIDLLKEETVRDYSCKCGGEFIFRQYRSQFDKPFYCDSCSKQKDFKNIEIIEINKSLKEDILETLDNSVSSKIQRELEELTRYNQYLLKLYRMWTDDLEEPKETTEDQLQQAKAIQEDFRHTHTLFNNNTSVSLLISDGKLERIDGTTDLKETISPRTRTLEEIDYSQSESLKEDRMQLDFKTILKMVKLNIPDQKERSKKVSLAVEPELIKWDKESIEIEREVTAIKKAEAIQIQNKEQKEEHESNLKTSLWYAVNHCKAHKPFLSDHEDRNLDTFEYDRFSKSEEDKFYLPCIKTHSWTYSSAGMITRAELIKNLLDLDPTVSPAYEIAQIKKSYDREEAKKQNAEHEKWVNEMLAKHDQEVKEESIC